MPKPHDLPAALEEEMSTALPYLLQKGWEIFEFRYDPELFGNWYIDLYHSRASIRLVKDRSQYSAESERGNLMQRVFADPKEFQQAVIDWVSSLNETQTHRA